MSNENKENTKEKQESSEYESDSQSFDELQKGVQSLDVGKQMTMATYCTNCGKQGVTKMLFVKIPKFQEMSISSFKCSNCGYSGRDVQQLAEYQNQGCEITLEVKCAQDLSRGLVKSSFCSVKILENKFEIEARPMSGIYTTLEGLIKQSAENLGIMQPERRIQNKEVADKIDDCILQLLNYIKQTQQQEKPEKTIFTLVLTDPSGNSFIEPFHDLPHITIKNFNRTMDQAKELGLSKEQEETIQKEIKTIKVDDKIVDDISITNQVTEIKSKCPACLKEIFHKSVIINIPYFKDCLLMAAKCDECGYKSIEIDSAGPIPKFGRKTTFHITDPSDLSREVLKSTSCGIKFIEIGVELNSGTLGGIYTTLEGLVRQIKDELEKHSQFWIGDSARSQEESNNMKKVLTTLQRYADGKEHFTIEIDDALDGSFIKNIYAPDPDPEMKIETYVRSKEQDEEWGLDNIDQGED